MFQPLDPATIDSLVQDFQIELQLIDSEVRTELVKMRRARNRKNLVKLAVVGAVTAAIVINKKK